MDCYQEDGLGEKKDNLMHGSPFFFRKPLKIPIFFSEDNIKINLIKILW